ncbi:MAG: hypothetical protein Q9174_005568 [Haloplaca sp. 1 TL-2023]
MQVYHNARNAEATFTLFSLMSTLMSLRRVRVIRNLVTPSQQPIFVLMASLSLQVKTTMAQNCSYPEDVVDYARAHFAVANWIRRAGVFSRAITGWIVQGVSKTEPMLHVIVNSTQEAQHVIARILSLDEEYTGTQDELRKVQVEIGGHVLVDQRRVAYRTPWYLRFFGVLAEPFDLRRVAVCEYPPTKGVSKSDSSTMDEVELGLLRK